MSDRALSHEDRGRLHTKWWLLGIVIVGAAVRIYALGKHSFWLDEAHSAAYTKLSITDLWSFDDPYDRSNPPGYILLLKIWGQLSRSDEWLRALSVLSGVAVLPVVYAIGTRLGSRSAGLLAAGYLAIAGYHVRYSQEARAYALIVFLTAVAFLTIAQLMTEPEGDKARPVRGDQLSSAKTQEPGLRRPVTWTDLSWFGYAAAVGIALHLHNTALAIPMASNLAVAIWWFRQRRTDRRFARNWLAANLAAFIIWLPWVPGFIRQTRLVTDSWWVPEPTWRIVLKAGASLFGGSTEEVWSAASSTWAQVALVLIVLIPASIGIQSIEQKYRPLLWSFLLVLPVVELLYSLRRPIFLQRTLVPMLVPIAVALGFALHGRRSAIKLSVGGILVVLGVASTVGYHTGFEKTAWEAGASFVEEHSTAHSAILVMPGNTIVAFDHYYSEVGDADEFSLPFSIPERIASGSQLTESDIDAVEVVIESYSDVFLVINGSPSGRNELNESLEGLAVSVDRFRGHDLIINHYVLAP